MLKYLIIESLAAVNTATNNKVLKYIKHIEETLTGKIIDDTHDNRDLEGIIQKRVLMRYRLKAKSPYFGQYEPKTFDELFDLPPWLTLAQWIHIQLRGRQSDDIFNLNIDHIVPLSVANTIEELRILMSWKNTRLINPELNTEKKSNKDAENTLLCERLLNRPFPKNWCGDTGREVVKTVDEKLNKLLKTKGKKNRRR